MFEPRERSVRHTKRFTAWFGPARTLRHEGQTTNLSERGLAIRSKELYGSGTVLRVAIKPLDQAAFDLEATVVWTNDPSNGTGLISGVMGLRLTTVDPRYIAFVQKVNEAANRRAPTETTPVWGTPSASQPTPPPSYAPAPRAPTFNPTPASYAQPVAPTYPAQPTHPSEPVYQPQPSYPAHPSYPQQPTYPSQSGFHSQPTYPAQPTYAPTAPVPVPPSVSTIPPVRPSAPPPSTVVPPRPPSPAVSMPPPPRPAPPPPPAPAMPPGTRAPVTPTVATEKPLTPASWDAFMSTGMPTNAPNVTAAMSVNVSSSSVPAIPTTGNTWPPGAALVADSNTDMRRLRMPRFDAALPLNWGTTSLANQGQTLNLSRSGLSIIVRDPVNPGSRLLLAIALPDGQVAKASGVAVWQRLSQHGFTSVGLRLLHADERYLKLIDLLARRR